MTHDPLPGSAATPEPICTGDCHRGDLRDFDHYCDSINATPGETPAAFGAWLNAMTGWDGQMERLS